VTVEILRSVPPYDAVASRSVEFSGVQIPLGGIVAASAQSIGFPGGLEFVGETK
jgi:hypothetical protein